MTGRGQRAAVLALHQRVTSRLEGVIGDDGELSEVSETEAIVSTEQFCEECRKPWPCRTVVLLSDAASSQTPS